ncbi:hypothetical protein CEXT_156691 [Caerostris extrusa]|uniref:Uncharacterized protein n=1 Tax=Caerostris extrusa TaxID=172846 RepID=A0AAV4W7D2_CAEEX|nr:hypothetical protein CEXT_156691 [Caerostris extrusa]
MRGGRATSLIGLNILIGNSLVDFRITQPGLDSCPRVNSACLHTLLAAYTNPIHFSTLSRATISGIVQHHRQPSPLDIKFGYLELASSQKMPFDCFEGIQESFKSIMDSTFASASFRICSFLIK